MQTIVFRSSTEVKYKALASSTTELCWIHMLLCDLGIFFSNPPLLWCDNFSALAIASNLTKHIEVDHHFVHERVLKSDLQVNFISSHDHLADIFTKCLPSPRFHWLTSKPIWKFLFRLRGMKVPVANLKRLKKGKETLFQQ